MTRTSSAFWAARIAIAMNRGTRNPINWKRGNKHQIAYAPTAMAAMAAASRNRK